jgi:hypothetical protein
MILNPEETRGIGLALNESRLLGLELHPNRRVANATFSVLRLPPEGSPPEDRRVQLVFQPVGHLAASLRLGYWDDQDAPISKLTPDQLLSVVQSFGGSPIYGWQFVDVDDKVFNLWKDSLSLDYLSQPGGLDHHILLFQESSSPIRHLDIWIWFDELKVFDPSWNEILLAEFIAAGKRWWDAFYSEDLRTVGEGIHPFSNGQPPSPPEGWIGRPARR